MPIDASIITRGVAPVQIENPLNRMAQVLQIQGAQQQMGLNALKADEYRRSVDEGNALRKALSAPDADPYKALLGMGKVKEATDFAKGQADVKKTQSEAEYKAIETAHKRVDSWGQAMGYVRQNPTPETAVAAVQHLVNMRIMPPEQAQAAIASIGQNPTPENISQWATMGFQAALQAKDQLPKYETKNTGGQTITQAIDPVTGGVKTVNSLQNTQSPDNAASVAATMRGQNMTDARARENTQVQREGLQAQRDAARTQVLETPDGVVLVDKGTGQARPATMNGQPLPGKPSAAVEKELVGIRQQNAIIDGAIQAATQTPSAFGLRRGMATLSGSIPESLAGRMDSDAERQARSYVFNNVSKIINERAGAAQSAQELARLRSFLPAETDSSDQITSKLQAFKTYLGDMEGATRGKPSASPAPAAPKTSQGGLTPEEQKELAALRARFKK